MKKFLMLFAMVVMGFFAMAQNQISYQAVVRDANNRLVTTGTVYVTVAILTSADAEQYTEGPVTVTPNANGLISMMIGGGTGWNTINWEGAKIKTTVKINGSDVVNTVPVTAVPYSLISKTVDPAVLEPYATKAQLSADSALLQHNIDTASAQVRIFVKDTLKAYTTTADLAATYATKTKVLNDSIALRALIDNNATNIATNVTNIANNKQAIIDSSAHIRNEVAENKQAIIDTAAHIRAEIAAGGYATLTKVKADSAFLHNLIKDTLSNYYLKSETFTKVETRKEISDTANVLRKEMKHTHAELVDSVKNFINQTTKEEMLAIVTTFENNAAIWDDLQDTIASLTAVYLHNALVSTPGSNDFVKELEYLAHQINTTTLVKNAEENLRTVYQALPEALRDAIKDTIVKRAIALMKSGAYQPKVQDVVSYFITHNQAWLETQMTPIVVDLVKPATSSATTIQAAINDAIVVALGQSVGTSINDAVKAALPTHMTVSDGVNPPQTYTITWGD